MGRVKHEQLGHDSLRLIGLHLKPTEVKCYLQASPACALLSFPNAVGVSRAHRAFPKENAPTKGDGE